MVFPHTYRTEHSETHTTNAQYGEYYAYSQSHKIHVQAPLLKILQYVDSNYFQFINDLREAVAIPSVTSEYPLKHKDDTINMIKYIEKWLIKLGIKYECFNIGHRLMRGKNVKLPPIILGTLKSGPKKKTLCIYAHIDVPDPTLNRWATNPWKVVENMKCLFGNGVALGKGPLLAWFQTILAFKYTKTDIPVNIKFIIESMNRSQSIGLEEFLMTRKQDYLYDIDYIVVCDSEWIGKKQPCLSYGAVGILHFKVTIQKPDQSKGDIKEEMEKIFERIIDNEDNILIPGFLKYVSQITPDEEKLYEEIGEFDIEEYRKNLPPHKQTWEKVQLLMNFWRLPSILVDDIQECICDKKDFTKIKRHFLVKIVPNQIVDNCINEVLTHIKNVTKDLGIENSVHCDLISATRPWLEECESVNYEAAKRATLQIYKELPNYIREDRDMRCINILQKIIGKSILLLPMGNKYSNSGRDNENLNLRNFVEQEKLLAAYLFQLNKEYSK